LEYWIEEGKKIANTLPRDHNGEEKNLVETQKSVTAWLGAEQTRELLQRVPEVYHTQVNDVLLTALWRVCAEWTGSERVRVDLEGHGREDVFEDLDVSRTVGWFTTIYPAVLGDADGRKMDV